MFYAHSILTRKGKLGIIWLAANYKGQKGKFLNSRDFKKVNIIKSCEYIINPTLPFALRLSSTLMVGVVRVYNEQTRIVLIEANEMMKAVKAAITEQRLAADLQLKQPEQRQDAITLPLLLDYELDLPECMEQIHTDYLVNFAKSDKYFRLPKVKSPKIQLPSPGSSPEQKISTEEERSPHLADLRDITIPEIDYNIIGEQEIKIPGEIDIVEPLPLEDLEPLPEMDGHTTDRESTSDLKVAEGPGEDAEVMIFDEQTGLLKPDATPMRETQTPSQEATPQRTPVDRQIPERPKRKRKLAVDFNIKLTGTTMRKNLNSVDALKKRKICDIPEIPTLKELFSNPATSVVQKSPFRQVWNDNAKMRPLEDQDMEWGQLDSTYRSPIIHEEASSGLEESPTSGIELLRAASRQSFDFEQSAGMDSTPEVSGLLEKSRRRSRDLSLSGDRKLDVGTGTPSKPLSRFSSADRLSMLSPIVDRDEDIPELAVPLEEIEEHLSLDESDHEKMPDDDRLYETLREVQEAMGDRSRVKLSSMLPPSTTKRKRAAILFYNIIALTNMGALALRQDNPYADIIIGRGRQY